MWFNGGQIAQWKTAMAIVLATAVAFMWTAVAAQATVLPAKGGQGDRAEEVRCPDGHILVGFAGRTGSWIDQISLMCARLVIPGFTTGDVIVLPPRGGNGGGPEEQYCEQDAGIRDIRIIEELKAVFHPLDGKTGTVERMSRELIFLVTFPATGHLGHGVYLDANTIFQFRKHAQATSMPQV